MSMSADGLLYDIRVYETAPGYFHAVLSLDKLQPPGFARLFTADAHDMCEAGVRVLEKFQDYRKHWR